MVIVRDTCKHDNHRIMYDSKSIVIFYLCFSVTDGPLGKRLNNTRTRQEVGWEPKYPSFAHFLASM
jgi:nucleoside-diphosphate-sugar epimerase